MEKLYTEQTENDSSAGNAIRATGRELAIHAFGTWDTATLTIKMSTNGTNNGVAEFTYTEDGFDRGITVPAGVTIWAELSSVGASTSVSCWVAGQGND